MKRAYLTIDNSPSSDMRRKVEVLSARGIPAVFFCRGDLLEQRPDDAIYAIKKGFIIGNHGYNHPRFSELNMEDCFEQVRRCDEIIDRLYQRAGVKRPVRWIRFLYGDKAGFAKMRLFQKFEGEGKRRKEELQEYVWSLGYSSPDLGVTYDHWRKLGLDQDIDWYWTYDVMEYMVRGTDPWFGLTSLQKVLERMDWNKPEEWACLGDQTSPEVILTHDHEQTTDMFEPIIDKLLSKGLQFTLPPFDEAK